VKKGLSTTVVGAIIGIFELVVVLLAPVYGKNVRIAFSVSICCHMWFMFQYLHEI